MSIGGLRVDSDVRKSYKEGPDSTRQNYWGPTGLYNRRDDRSEVDGTEGYILSGEVSLRPPYVTQGHTTLQDNRGTCT